MPVLVKIPEEHSKKEKELKLYSQNYITHDSDDDRSVKKSNKKKVWVSPQDYVDEIMQEMNETKKDILLSSTDLNTILKNSKNVVEAKTCKVYVVQKKKLLHQDYIDELLQKSVQKSRV